MNRASAIPLRIFIVLCLCLLVLNILVLVAAFLLLDLPLFVLLFIALALGIIAFVAIVGLFWQKPKAKIRSTSDRPVISRSEERPPLRTASSPSFEKPKPIIAVRTEPRPSFNRGFGTTKPPSSKCPHGKTKEYCAICDLNGYERHYGDWKTD